MTDRGKPALTCFEYRPDGPVRSLDANLPNSDEVCDACGGSETATNSWHPMTSRFHESNWTKPSTLLKSYEIVMKHQTSPDSFDLQHWVACEVPRHTPALNLLCQWSGPLFTMNLVASCRLLHEHQKHSKRQEGHEVLCATVALWMLSSTCNFFILFIWFHLSAYDRMQKEFISHLLVAPGSRFNGRMLEYVRTADISRSSQLLGRGAPPGLPTQRWDVAWLALLWKSLTEFCKRIYLYMNRYG